MGLKRAAFQRKQRALADALAIGARLARHRRRTLLTAVFQAWRMRGCLFKTVRARLQAVLSQRAAESFERWRAFVAAQVRLTRPRWLPTGIAACMSRCTEWIACCSVSWRTTEQSTQTQQHKSETIRGCSCLLMLGWCLQDSKRLRYEQMRRHCNRNLLRRCTARWQASCVELHEVTLDRLQDAAMFAFATSTGKACCNSAVNIMRKVGQLCTCACDHTLAYHACSAGLPQADAATRTWARDMACSPVGG